MPRKDGTGPMGAGPMTGRGRGPCADGSVGYGAGYGAGYGFGMGRRRGCGRGFGRQFAPDFPQNDVSQKDLLTEQKRILEERLENINKRLDTL
ncbi:MAG: DUF5320 domain-containing protein [Christensenellales bacterium]